MSHLTWGGSSCLELAERFGTPLYVLDEDVIRARCAEVRRSFLDRWHGSTAFYASKAFLTRAMARIVDQEGLGLDVVSLGELHTALRAGFPPGRIELHGNAKSEEELRAALSVGVGRIVVDGSMELDVLIDLAERMGARARILIRVAPGVEADTHAHIATGHEGSKFGVPLEGDVLPRMLHEAQASGCVELMGLHSHVGSQLFDPDDHVRAVERLVEAMARLRGELGFEPRELGLGGGFGAQISPDVPHVPLALFTDAMMEALSRGCAAHGLALPAASIEPGRWIVSEAGLSLYRIETVKELPDVIYLAVDGGMSDNPRYALYGARYRATLAERPDAPAHEQGRRVCIAGKCCESGDVLIEDARPLPHAGRGDVLAIFNAGAYTFSMASNYDRLGRPAVVLVGTGHEPEVIVERQSPEDLLRGDVIPARLGGG